MSKTKDIIATLVLAVYLCAWMIVMVHEVRSARAARGTVQQTRACKPYVQEARNQDGSFTISCGCAP